MMSTGHYRRPYYADVQVTSRCNLKCDFCSASAPGIHSNVNQLKIEDINRIFKELDELGILRVSLEGGEPFLRNDFLDIMKLADIYDFEYYVNTNATLINKKMAKEISRTSVRKLCISIDGPNETIHDICRGQKGAFEKTIDAIKNLQEYNINIDGIITLSRLNVNCLIETIEFISSLGISNVAIMLLASVGYASNNFSQVYLPFDEWSHTLLTLTDLKKSNLLTADVRIVSTGESRCPWELYLPLLKNNRQDDIDSWIRQDSLTNFSEGEFFCTAGKDNLAIDGAGNVYGCSLMVSEPGLRAGNVLKEGLIDIWDKSVVFNELRSNQRSDVKGACASCELLNTCGGGCRACAFALNKDLLYSDTRCPIAQ